MLRCRLLVMWLPLVYCPASIAADAGSPAWHREEPVVASPQIRVEYEPAPDTADAGLQKHNRPVRKWVLADGTEITHLEGRGMEELHLLDEGEDGLRTACGVLRQSVVNPRQNTLIDFRSRTRAPSAGNTDAH